MSTSKPTAGTRPIVVAGRRAVELALDRFTLVIEDGPDRGRTATLSSTSLRVGTAAGNDLVLQDPTVSGHHAVFTLTPSGVHIEDRDSTNGSWLSGVRLQSAVLPDGAVVRVGNTPLRLQAKLDRWVVFPEETPTCFGLLGRSQAMRDLFALLRQLARSDLPVLVTGETGTGKELVSRAIHDGGPKKDRPYLVLDCGAILPDLLRAELFGHEKGAFTGADRMTRGILEEAAGGTVMLDELGEMDLAVQPQLLRALEVREICRLGSRKALPVDFRIVAVTNKDLASMAQTGAFRPDLYYRLSGVTIRLPPLRERVEDIELLAGHFLEQAAARQGLPRPKLEAPALKALEAHPWPGNVRELKNVVEALCVLSDGRAIAAEQVCRALPPSVGSPVGAPAPSPAVTSLEETERTAITAALQSTAWNRTTAARLLKIAPSTLFEKIRKYGLKPPA